MLSVKKFLGKNHKTKKSFFNIKTFFPNKNQIFERLQKLGQALLFPIAVLPIAALLMRIGVLLSNPVHGAGGGAFPVFSPGWYIGYSMFLTGNAVFSNLGIVFAVGLAFGFAKDFRGESALSSLVAMLAFNSLLYSSFSYNNTTHDFSIISIYPFLHHFYTSSNNASKDMLPSLQNLSNTGILGGIIVGCWTAWLYNRFSNVKLHPILSFFSGRRLVPILSITTVLLAMFVFVLIWTPLGYVFYKFGIAFGNMVGTNGSISSGKQWIVGLISGVYGIVNRSLLPIGLHNVLNVFLWFQIPFGKYDGDITAFLHGQPGSGNFQTGFFASIAFGLPAAGVAMILSAEKKQRNLAFGIFGSSAIVAFLTGVTEPIEFSFLYAVPFLYGIHIILTGLFSFLLVGMNLHIGFGFSASIIDYIISFPISNNLAKQGDAISPLYLLPMGVLCSATYFCTFYFSIKLLKLKSPGTKENPLENESVSNLTFVPVVNPKDKKVAEKYLKDKNSVENLDLKYLNECSQIIYALGGFKNIKTLGNCLTRMRVTVYDSKLIKNDLFKQGTKVIAVARMTDNTLQIIYGPNVQFYVDYISNSSAKIEERIKELFKNKK